MVVRDFLLAGLYVIAAKLLPCENEERIIEMDGDPNIFWSDLKMEGGLCQQFKSRILSIQHRLGL